MMKKKSHPEFVRALKARNLKITVVGTYENCLSRVAVRCDVCGWEWAPVGGSLSRSEKLLKISKVSYAWKTYRKHFSRSLDFVEIIPRPRLEPL